MRFPFKLLKVKNYPNKHWCDNIGWVMVEVLHSIVVQVMKLALDKANVFALSCNEFTSIDNYSWLSIHAYTIQNWTKDPMLLSLEHLVDGFTMQLV